MRKIIKYLDRSGQSEAIAIGKVLESAMDDDDYDYDLMIAILDQFEGWAKDARGRLEKTGLR